VVDFHDDECPSIGFCDDRMRGYQDLLQGSDFPEASPERAFVVVTGGSVAYGIANNSTEGKLEQALSTIPELKDKEIIIYTFALGGYKQPQQLFAIQYYLAMGVHFDMIINVDGFNEIVLPLVENIPFHTNPFFPRIWHDRVTRGVENRKKKLLHGMQAYLNEQRSIIAVQMNKAFLRKSALRNLIWKIRDSSLKSRVAQAEVEYLDDVKNNPRIESKLITLGTKFERGYDEPMLERIADFWGRSSELLYDVAKGENIKYYHFLQPNQYVDGSKPMSPEERGIALLEGSPLVHPYAASAKQGYPYLIARGEELDKAGVPFHDLTMMFQENEELLYRDACCHYNTKGYDYIIDEIVSTMIVRQYCLLTVPLQRQRRRSGSRERNMILGFPLMPSNTA
jgi:hypothetical protein